MDDGKLIAPAAAAPDDASKLVKASIMESQTAITNAWLHFLESIARDDNHIIAAIQSNLVNLYPGLLLRLNCFIIAFLLFICITVTGLLCKRKALQASERLCAPSARERHTLFYLLDVSSLFALYLAIAAMTELLNDGNGSWGVNLARAIEKAGSSLEELSLNVSNLRDSLLTFAEDYGKKVSPADNTAEHRSCLVKLNEITSNTSHVPLIILSDFAEQMKQTAFLLQNFDEFTTQPGRPLLLKFLALFQAYGPYWSTVGLLLFLLILFATALVTLTHAAYGFQESENTRKVFAPRIAWISKISITHLLQTFWIHLSLSLAVCNLLALPVLLGSFTKEELCKPAGKSSYPPSRSFLPLYQTVQAITVNELWQLHTKSFVPSTPVSAVLVIRDCENKSFMEAYGTSTSSLVKKFESLSKESACAALEMTNFSRGYEQLFASQDCKKLNEAHKVIGQAICSGASAVAAYWKWSSVLSAIGLSLITISYVLQSRLPVVCLKTDYEKRNKPSGKSERTKTKSNVENKAAAAPHESKVESIVAESPDLDSTELGGSSNYEEDEEEDDEKAMGECEYFSAQEAVVAMCESPYIDSREIEMLNLNNKFASK